MKFSSIDLISICHNKNSSPEILEKLYFSYKNIVDDNNGYFTDNRVLFQGTNFLDDKLSPIKGLINNKNTPLKVLEDIGELAFNALVSRDLEVILACDTEERLILITHDTSDHMYEALYQSKDLEVLTTLAEHDKTTDSVLFKLAQHKSKEIKFLVAQNLNRSIQTLNKLVEDKDEEVRSIANQFLLLLFDKPHKNIIKSSHKRQFMIFGCIAATMASIVMLKMLALIISLLGLVYCILYI